jgi:hypothetical protein
MVAWGGQINLQEASGSTPEAVHDHHVYVHEPSQLADRLDQFAVMFDSL